DRHVFVDAEEVGDVADLPPDVLRLAVDRVAADVGLAARRAEERGQDLHGRRFSGAVGPYEPVDVALVDDEVQLVDGDEVLVDLRQVAGLDHASVVTSILYVQARSQSA